jgi:transcriptional regulator with XRE-family HTH domain
MRKPIDLPRGHRVSDLNHEPDAVLYARKKAGLKQAHAAVLLSISASYLSEIEKGTRNANDALLHSMATVYNCPLVVLERKRWSA